MQQLILGFITLLIVLIVALICIIVLRDRRDLKAKQIAADLHKMEELVRDLLKVKGDLMPALSGLKKHADILSQIEGQLKQISSALSGLEHRQPAAVHPQAVPGENQEDRRDRGPKQPGRGKGWGGNRPERNDRGDRGDRGGVERGDRSDSGYRDKRRELSAAPQGASEAITINDGQRYAKVAELAANGLTAQEIAKKLNVEQEQVALIMELKGKKPL